MPSRCSPGPAKGQRPTSIAPVSGLIMGARRLRRGTKACTTASRVHTPPRRHRPCTCTAAAYPDAPLVTRRLRVARRFRGMPRGFTRPSGRTWPSDRTRHAWPWGLALTRFGGHPRRSDNAEESRGRGVQIKEAEAAVVHGGVQGRGRSPGEHGWERACPLCRRPARRQTGSRPSKWIANWWRARPQSLMGMAEFFSALRSAR